MGAVPAVLLAGILVVLLATGCARSDVAQFTPFLYEADAPQVASDEYRNPILPGFYPDPSICRTGDDYWMVNSSFGYFPGLPVWHSTDLIHWESCGHALESNDTFFLGNQNLICGTFAPQISYNPANGLYYIICTFVGGYGNFFVTCDNPLEGSWSDPVLLPEVKGIDPSLLFDSDGRAYITSATGLDSIGEKPLYGSDNVILLWDFDWENGRTTGSWRELVRHGVQPREQPKALEGPHLYHIGDRYFLLCAEGGTELGHSEVAFVSDSPYGPFTPCPVNPILTQRDLGTTEGDFVACTGHADLVCSAAGEWYAVFLGTQPYDGLWGFNTGRQTFLLPVTWTDEQMIILPAGERVPLRVPMTEDLRRLAAKNRIDGFDAHRPGPLWSAREGLAPFALFLRNPVSDTLAGGLSAREPFDLKTSRRSGPFWNIDPRGRLSLRPKRVSIRSQGNPSAICLRISAKTFRARTTLRFHPASAQERAGIICYQNEENLMQFLRTLDEDGRPVMLLEAIHRGKTVSRFCLPLTAQEASRPLRLEVEATDARTYVFRLNGEPVGEALDGRILSSPEMWGFLGAVVGIYAASTP